MKLANHNIHALAKKLFHHNQGVQRPKLMHPERDWLIGVLVGLMIIVAMISWSAYTYIEKRSAIGLDDTGVEPQVPVYKSDTVEDALEIFTQRGELFKQLNQSTIPAVESLDVVVATTTSSTTDEVEEGQIGDVITEEDIDQTIDSESVSPDQPVENVEDLGSPMLME